MSDTKGQLENQAAVLSRYKELAQLRRDEIFRTIPQRDPNDPETRALRTLQVALERLRTMNPRAAEAIELRYFGRMNARAVAKAIERSQETGSADLRFARAWLLRAISESVDGSKEIGS